MMSDRLQAVAERRAELVARSAQQRDELAAYATVFERPLQVANAAARFGQFVKRRPVLFFATAGVAAMAARRNYAHNRQGVQKVLAAVRLVKSVARLVRHLKQRYPATAG